jgi:hypothetical protein
MQRQILLRTYTTKAVGTLHLRSQRNNTGSAKDKLMTCDPSIPDKINEEKAKIEALRRKNAAEAEVLQFKKQKEAREFAALCC